MILTITQTILIARYIMTFGFLVLKSEMSTGQDLLPCPFVLAGGRTGPRVLCSALMRTGCPVLLPTFVLTGGRTGPRVLCSALMNTECPVLLPTFVLVGGRTGPPVLSFFLPSLWRAAGQDKNKKPVLSCAQLSLKFNDNWQLQMR